MAKVIVVGDGPAGLSAALFTARGGHETVVYGEDKTAMHYADLHNYLGIEQVLGSDFQSVAAPTASGSPVQVHVVHGTSETPTQLPEDLAVTNAADTTCE